MTETEKNVVLAHNAARTNQKKFAKLYVQELASHYIGKYIQYPGEGCFKTHEGKKAVEELYRFLQRQKALLS